MWRGALVKISTNDYEDVNIFTQELARVLPSNITRRISHLSNVAFPDVGLVKDEGHENPASSLLNYPSLKVCIAPNLNYEKLGLIKYIDGLNIKDYLVEVFQNIHNDQWGQELVLLEVRSGLQELALCPTNLWRVFMVIEQASNFSCNSGW